MTEHCVRCNDEPAVDGGLVYCAHCYWAAKAEVAQGLHDLQLYLANWARFAEWCAAHDQGRHVARAHSGG
jgi:hypothetical protein